MYDMLVGKKVKDVSNSWKFEDSYYGNTVGFSEYDVVYKYTLDIDVNDDVLGTDEMENVKVKVYADSDGNIIEFLGKSR